MGKLRSLKVMLGGALFAIAVYAILAAPGLLTDTASTVPTHQQRIVAVRR